MREAQGEAKPCMKIPKIREGMHATFLLYLAWLAWREERKSSRERKRIFDLARNPSIWYSIKAP